MNCELNNSSSIFSYNDKGFEVAINSQLLNFEWEQISRITAYKIDLLTIDEICILIEYANNRSLELSESAEGWIQFIERLKIQFPTISKTWEFDIVQPAFERKETELYNRKNF